MRFESRALASRSIRPISPAFQRRYDRMGRSSKMAAFSSVTDQRRNRLSAARNAAAPSASVIAAGAKSRGVVSMGSHAVTGVSYLAHYSGIDAKWQYLKR